MFCSPEIRRPKVEGRKKSEVRSPKAESPSASGFGLRISELGLLSELGLRASDFKVFRVWDCAPYSTSNR